MAPLRRTPAQIARCALLAVAAPMLLAATFGDPDEDAATTDPTATDSQELTELTARCRSLIATFDKEAGARPDSDILQSALHLRTTAGTECADGSQSLMENGIDDLHMALRILGVAK